jgi:trehalose 6-phosphate phosphatase
MTYEPGGFPPPAQEDWAYFLDVDGTLIEIAERPEAVCVPDSLIGLLATLQRASGGACALVSGRKISELDTMFAPLRLPASGVHGMERRHRDGAILAVDPRDRDHDVEALQTALAQARVALTAFVDDHPGLGLEDKGTALAIHYRAAPALGEHVAAAGDALLALYPVLVAQPGKMVLELKPRGVDKGVAIRRHLDEPPFLGRRPVYVGDDLTDEHGFMAVNALDGVSVRVGDTPDPTLARWRVPSVGAVHAWLEALTSRFDFGGGHGVA